MGQHVRYTARRSLVAGHAAGSSYYLNLYVDTKDRERRVRSEVLESLNGSTYTTYRSGLNAWNIRTVPMTLAQSKEMREFLDSVEDGQSFQYCDEGWSGDSPIVYVPVILEQKGYRERRTQLGQGQAGDRFSFSFLLRQLPA